MAAGITQPGGAGTTIYIYDDTDTSGGRAAGSYTFAQIANAFPADFINLGTYRPSYRSAVSIQIGDTTTNAATTTLEDTNCAVFFDNGKTLSRRGTQTTSWHIKLGTKVGTGNTASGKSGVELVLGASAVWSGMGTINLYGCKITLKASGTATMSIAASPTTMDWQNCIFHSEQTGNQPFSFGAVNQPLGNLYNCDFSHSTTTNQIVSNLYASTCERITLAATAPQCFLTLTLPVVVFKDPKFIGTPTTSDIRWSGANVISDVVVRPIWSGNAPKFSALTAGNPALSFATQEQWLFDVKIVDGTGTAISGIPVKLTDTIGNVQVNTTTDADGCIVFGSGLQINAVTVMDHYMVTTTYTQRHRSPFTVEANTGVGRNPAYKSYTATYNWPGYDSITTSAGQFKDVEDIIYLESITQGTMDAIPVEAAGVDRILVPLGART